MHPSPSPFRPPPEWGPDRETQQANGTTARSWFGSMCTMLSDIDPRLPIIQLARVSKHQDWTPALLDALHTHLQHATDDPMAAWATYNILLEKAILTCNIPLIRTCLAEHRWHLCMDNEAPTLVLATGQCCRQILPLLLADPRFTGEWLRERIVNRAVVQYATKDDCVLSSILEIPSVDPWIVWQGALRVAGQSVWATNVWVAGKSELVDPEWAWRRSVATSASTTPSLPQNTPSLLGGVPCPKLLIDLPEDVQFKMHQLLDAQSVGRIRSTCRSLTSFPMTRFAGRPLHFECYRSATLPAYQFSTNRFQSLLSAKASLSREKFIGRVLVESARHMTDLDFSLDLLSQLTNAQSPTTAAVYLTWTLFTLLTSLLIPTSATCTLLNHLLLHPHLPLAAWSLVAFNYPSAMVILGHANATDSPPPAPSPAPETSAYLYLHLLTTHTFPTGWQPLPTHFPELFRADPGPNSPLTPAIETVLLLALATLAESQDTLTTLLSPPVVLDTTMKWIMLCHALAHSSSEHVAHVLAQARPAAAQVRIALLNACDAARGDEARWMALVDVLFASMSAGELRAFLVMVRLAESREVSKVRARGMWWCLEIGQEAWDAEVARWIEWDINKWARCGGEDGGHMWVTELRERWEGLKKSRRRRDKKCVVQ